MPENNPFSSPNNKPRSGGILDIDKIIEQEKVHAHKGAVPIVENSAAATTGTVPVKPVAEPVAPIEKLPEVETVPAAEEFVNDEPSQASVDERYDDEPEGEQTEEPETESEPAEQPDEPEEPAEDVATWRSPSRRIPRLERPRLDEMAAELEPPADGEQFDETPEPTDDIILNNSRGTPNRRNLILIIGGAIVAIGLIILIPRLIEGGVLFKTNDTGTTGESGTPSDSANVTAGLSRDVQMKKVSDGLQSDDPDRWQATFTVDTTDITLEVDCTPKSGGGTSPNLSCVSSSSNGVVDGTFVKPFTAGEGWTYDGVDYGYCFSFADKVSARTVQSDLYGSSGVQLFYMADDFKICSKRAGNPDQTPKGTPCDNQKAYCPAVRLRSIK